MRDEKLYNLFENFVNEIYPLIDEALEKKWTKPQYDKYPHLDYKENGMPRITNYSFNSPPKISDLFRSWNGKTDINLKEYESYKLLLNYLLPHEEYRKSIYPDHLDTERADNIYNDLAPILIENILERYYHLRKKNKDDNLLKTIYTQSENYIYAEYLYFDISIPILFLSFSEDEFEINENFIELGA